MNPSRKFCVVNQNGKWPSVAKACDHKPKIVIRIVQDDCAVDKTDGTLVHH